MSEHSCISVTQLCVPGSSDCSRHVPHHARESLELGVDPSDQEFDRFCQISRNSWALSFLHVLVLFSPYS